MSRQLRNMLAKMLHGNRSMMEQERLSYAEENSRRFSSQENESAQSELDSHYLSGLNP